MKNRRLAKLLLLAIILLAFTLRFYKLGEIPLGLNTDETGIGYNAYSILHSGKDEHGAKMPLYFLSYGDNKLPVYIYLTSASIYLFGVNEFAVRFSSFIFGSLTIITLYYLVLTLSKKVGFALLASFLLAINPWHIFFSRVGFEVNVAISLLTLGALFFIISLGKDKARSFYFVLSASAFLLSLYCYNVTRVLSPLMFITLMFLYKDRLILMPKKYFISGIALFIFGIVPFLLSLSGGPGLESQKSVMIIGGERLALDIEFRSYIYSMPIIINKLLFNNNMLIAWNYIRNIFSFFSVDFFFINGANHPINGVGNFGMFHLIEAVFIPLGLFAAIKKRLQYLYPFILWMIIVILLGSITKEVPHPTRMYGITIPFTIFSAYGLFITLRYLEIQNSAFRKVSILILISFFTYSILYYAASYFLYFPTKYAKQWRSEDKSLTNYITSIQGNYNKIIVDDSASYAYSSLLYYSAYSPQIMHTSAKFGPSGLLISLKSVGKIEFRSIDWEKEAKSNKTLFITLNNLPNNQELLKVFYFPTVPAVLFYDNKFVQFPVTDVAYRVYH